MRLLPTLPVFAFTLVEAVTIRPLSARADSRVRGESSNLLAAGYSHAVLIPYGASWGVTWGTDVSGELGDGATMTSSPPTDLDVNNYAAILAIAAGQNFTVAVDAVGGSLWGWGLNTSNQAGYSGGSPVTTPIQISTPGVTWKAIAAGYSHACAITGQGSLKCWGSNAEGALGTGSTSPSQTATPTSNYQSSMSWIDVSAGNDFTVALRADGTAWAWGTNGSGQLGAQSSASYTAVPFQCIAEETPSRYVSVAAGGAHALAIAENGTLWGWGSNSNGQLGFTGGGSRSYPVPIAAGTWIAVSAGGNDSFAIRSDGTLWSWGQNNNGQLGYSTGGADQTTLAQVADPAGTNCTMQSTPNCIGFQYIAAGSDFTLAVTADGDLLTWGNNGDGQLGKGGGTTSTPARVPDTDAWTFSNLKPGELAAGPGDGATYLTYDAAYIRTSGVLETWGYNAAETLGLSGGGSGTVDQLSPCGSNICWQPIPVVYYTNSGSYYINPTPWIAVSTGAFSTLAIRSDGTLWGWGGNVGTGPTGQRIPIAIATPETGVPWLKVATDPGITGGLGILADGSLWGWGSGDPPALVCGSGSACQGSCWANVSLANGTMLGITTDGQLWGWGSNGGGELAGLSSGPAGGPTSPVQLDSYGPSTWSGMTWLDTQISDPSPASPSALDSYGRLWGWGYNPYSNVGDGYPNAGASACGVSVGSYAGTDDATSCPSLSSCTGCSATPVLVVTNVVQATRCSESALALDSARQLWGWGGDQDGELGLVNNAIANCATNLVSGAISPSVPVAGQTCSSVSSNGWDNLFAGALSLSAGAFTSFVQDGAAEVWATGDNTDGALGVGQSAGSQTNSPQFQSVLSPGSAYPSSVTFSSGSSVSPGINDGGYWTSGTGGQGPGDVLTLNMPETVYLTGIGMWSDSSTNVPGSYQVSVSINSNCSSPKVVASSSSGNVAPLGEYMSITFPVQPAVCVLVETPTSSGQPWDVEYIWGIQ
jgi:alpha-tubulin suppressor-like RCC1 family protein